MNCGQNFALIGLYALGRPLFPLIAWWFYIVYYYRRRDEFVTWV